MIYCDVTVLYYHRGRVTGIPRVVQRYADYLLRTTEVRFVYFDMWSGGFREMPQPAAEALVRAEEPPPPAPAWRQYEKTKRWFLKFSNRAPRDGPASESHSVNVEAGAPLLVFFVTSAEHRQAIQWAAERGLRVHAFVYDLIPIRVPQFCDQLVMTLFPASLEFLIDVSHCIFCISVACAEDLADYAKERGKELPRTEVVYLGDDVLQGGGDSDNLDAPKGAFLCVATIEPRKNQEILVNLWDRFAVEGRNDIPPLILVGRKGWLVDDFLARFRNNPRLEGHVYMYNGVSDQDLVALYQRCRMTLFPSFYETWSLPIRESLAAGKFVLAGDSLGLREAGEGLTEHIDPLDFVRWRKRVIHYATDDNALAEKEAEIRKRFKPRSWDCSARHAVQLMEHP